MNIPCLGDVTKDEQLGWYCSPPIHLPLLKQLDCRIIVEGYDDDDGKAEFHSAIANLLACDFAVLKEAEQHVYRYYKDVNSHRDPSDDEFLSIASPSEVWRHVQFGREPMVTRRAYGDKAVYVSIECECDWEPEHGLQIVLRGGVHVVKVGPYDGHLTNSDACADRRLEDVVYKSISA